jgi:nonsense-mediated mRNA decay protein 3
LNDEHFSRLVQSRALPDVILVKKSYAQKSKKKKPRFWKLRSLTKEEGDEDTAMQPSLAEAMGSGNAGRKKAGRAALQEEEQRQQDLDIFLDDLEHDPELRSAVNIYKGKEICFKRGLISEEIPLSTT